MTVVSSPEQWVVIKSIVTGDKTHFVGMVVKVTKEGVNRFSDQRIWP